MKLYADTANLEEIDYLNSLGIITGVTTNPSIIAKEPKGDFIKLIKPIANLCQENKLSLSVEVFNTEFEKMLDEAINISDKLSEYKEILKIKIPVTFDGLKAIKVLKKKGISTNATACYTEQQLMLAATAGASYVSLFYCRLEQSGGNCEKVLKRTRHFIEQNNFKTEIISGSIRTQTDASNAWNYGSHIVTTSSSVINEMIVHPKTDDAIKQFTRDFESWGS